MVERIIVVGDIHGEYGKLQKALGFAGYRYSDQLIFLGDYLNRGSESRAVIEFLLELKKEERHIFLRGNHEDIILKLLSGDTQYWYTWLEYGEGRACISSYGENPERIFYSQEGYFIKNEAGDKLLDSKETIRFIKNLFPHEHLQFIEDTILTFEIENYFFTHAGIEVDMPLEEQGIYAEGFVLWGDEDFLHDKTDYGKRVVYGHYHAGEPLIQSNKICLALEREVAILDISEGIIYDSLERVFRINP